MATANLNLIEPDARRRMEEFMSDGRGMSEEKGQSMMTHSIAISLKRLADAAETLLLWANEEREGK